MKQSNKIVILIAVSIIFHISIGIPLAEHENQIIEENNKISFLTSTLQATAAMVGIVFAISIVIIEHSASNYSPRILELFKKDGFFIFTLSFGLFTIAFISLTILNNWQTALISSSLFLWNLILLGIYLWYILTKINPLAILKELESDIISQINKIKSKLPSLEREYVSKDNSGTMLYAQKQTPEFMKSFILTNNQELISEILDDEKTLQHIILVSFRKEEYQTSSIALEKYSTVLKEYLKIIPNYQWPNDQFIELIISRFENFTSKAIEEKDITFLRQVIPALNKIGQVLTSIPELEYSIQFPMPISRQIHSLSNIGKQCISKLIWDGVIDSVINLGNIGTSVIQKYRKDGYVSKYISEIGNESIKLRESITSSRAAYEIIKLIQYMIAYKCDPTRTRMAIEELRDLLVNFQNARIQTMTLASLFFDTPKEISLRGCAEQAFLILNEEFPKIETKWREDLEKNAISALINLLGEVGIANKSHDTLIAKDCAENLSRIASRCVVQTFYTVEDGHKEEIIDIINFLRRMHSYDSGHSSLYSKENPLRLAEVAIICMQNNIVDLTEECINKISDIAHQSLKFDKHGYESNRMLRQLNLVGCAAIELNNKTILDKIAESISEFDEPYYDKFHELPRDELNLEQTSWEVDPFEDTSQIFNMTEIMKMDNRIKFERLVTQKRIQKLKQE